jgi:hypothetical protein
MERCSFTARLATLLSAINELLKNRRSSVRWGCFSAAFQNPHPHIRLIEYKYNIIGRFTAAPRLRRATLRTDTEYGSLLLFLFLVVVVVLISHFKISKQ